MNTLIRQINETAAKPGSICLWWIGQEGFVVKSRNLTIFIDPYLSDYAERITAGKPNEHIRMTPAPMRADDVTNADLVICTHDHADHIDPDGIPIIAQKSPQAEFVVPQCARGTLLDFGIAERRIHTLKGNDSLEIKGIRISGIPAKHEQFNKSEEHGFPFLSYVVKIDGITLFHAGDTIPYRGQVEKVAAHDIQIALLPINGRDEFRHKLEFEGNFTCKEAAGFATAINAGLTIPMHYDMFTLNTADVKDFIAEAEKHALNYKVMTVSRMLRYPLES
ncbi:MAG: MBL fold metallo-hydrolase [Victivallales bacterium]